MTNEEPESAPSTPEATYPPATIPTAYIDGVANLSHSPEVVKFYLSRFDPSTNVKGPPQQVEVVQIVMSVSGFATTAVFFGQMLDRMLKDGTVNQEFVDNVRKVSEQEAPQDGGSQT